MLAADPTKIGKSGQEIADALMQARAGHTAFPYRFAPCFVGANIQGRDFSRMLLGFDDDAHDNGRSSESYYVLAANFSRVNAANAVFDHTDLYGAVFRDAILDGASFRGSDLRSVDFSGATGLVPEQVAGAIYDSSTIWPEGFNLSLVPELRLGGRSSSAWIRAKDRDPELARRMELSPMKFW